MDNDEKTPALSDDRDRRDAAAQADGTPSEPVSAEAPTERLDEASAPAAASASAAPAAAPAAPAAPAVTDETRRSRRTRNTLIGVGAGVALLAFGGGAFAIGTAVGDDDDDDRPGVHAPAGPGAEARGGQPGQPRPGDDRGGDRDDDRDGDDHPGDDSAAASAPADADALRTAAEAAIAHASAEGVTSIEIERGGYDIDARLADGTELDLFVTPEGAVRERGNDDVNDDDDDDPLIDLAQLGDILTAAQSAATDAGATGTAFHSLSTSSSAAVYEVELRTGARGDAEVELDADLGVVRVDLDD